MDRRDLNSFSSGGFRRKRRKRDGGGIVSIGGSEQLVMKTVLFNA
ncbi:hypothetical protein [Sulfitobacter sp. MOLA879]